MHLVCPHCMRVNRVPESRLAEDPKCGHCHERVLEGAPVALTSGDFDTFIERNDLPVVVDFWADWCGPCKMFAPTFARATAENRLRVRFAKLDTEAHGDIAQRLGIRSIPTMILFKAGAEAQRISGALDAQGLRNWLQSNAV